MKESTPYYAKPKLLTHDRLPDKQTELAVGQPYLLLNRQWPLGQMEKKRKEKKMGSGGSRSPELHSAMN